MRILFIPHFFAAQHIPFYLYSIWGNSFLAVILSQYSQIDYSSFAQFGTVHVLANLIVLSSLVIMNPKCMIYS